MRNPNGYGSVTKLSGNRRKPWVVKVTIGFDDKNGKQIQKCIGTFESRTKALDCLSLYNLSKQNKDLAMGLNPETVKEITKKAKITHTFGECVEAVIERDKNKRSKSWLKCRIVGSKLLSELIDKNIDELDLFAIQKVFDKLKNEKKSQATLNLCKIICTSAFEYAIIHRWIDRNDDYSKYIDATSIADRTVIHKPFTMNEICTLVHDDSLMSKIVLTYIFTGCRATELLNVKKYDEYITCGVKTKSGKNRKIPIHSYISFFIDDVIDYLKDKNYGKIKYLFIMHMKKLNMDHNMHDTRNTFATLGKEADMKPSVIKKIMGHKTNDLTDDVYTHESIEYLKKEIEKIKINF